MSLSLLTVNFYEHNNMLIHNSFVNLSPYVVIYNRDTKQRLYHQLLYTAAIMLLYIQINSCY